MDISTKENGITLAIETLENKDVVLVRLGLFSLFATNIEKMLAEYIFEKTKNDSLRDTPLGVKEKEFNNIVALYAKDRYKKITHKLKAFKKRRNDLTHKTLIIDPKHFPEVLFINWRNTETTDEISSEAYLAYINDSIDIGRDLLADLVTLFLYESLEDKEFTEARKMTTKMPFCFYNKHC